MTNMQSSVEDKLFINITEVSYTINDTKVQLNSTGGFCNHLVPAGQVQAVWIIKVH